MRFICDGRVYSAGDLRIFRTPDPSIPFICLTGDGRATFVVNRDLDGVLSVHRAATGEIIAMSRRFNIAALMAAFPSKFAPAQIISNDLSSKEELEPFLVGADPHLFGTPRAGVLT